jgi:glycopeptide antibiotics resistance protein
MVLVTLLLFFSGAFCLLAYGTLRRGFDDIALVSLITAGAVFAFSGFAFLEHRNSKERRDDLAFCTSARNDAYEEIDRLERELAAKRDVFEALEGKP